MAVELTVDGRLVATWDAAEHPYWPPVDSDGKLIGDLPWKFFDGAGKTSDTPDSRSR